MLIDTAGRYTTQESERGGRPCRMARVPRLLKRTRPRQPLNGLHRRLPAQRHCPGADSRAHGACASIRRRIEEVETQLGVRMPVYVLFTKADLIAGFTEFFDDLDREQRAQVWGSTFALGAGKAGPLATFADEFRALVDRLNARLFRRLHAERNPDRRALIAMFPGQIASLEQRLAESLRAAFGGSPADPAPLLRGAYLTSGTQEGTPIDRLTRTLARTFGVDQAQAPSLRSERGRSYFLERLLRNVIFGEAMLISYSPGAVRRRVVARAAGIAVALLAVTAVGTLLWNLRDAGMREIDAAKIALNGYEQTARTLPLDPVADADLPRLAPLLDQARALPNGADDTDVQEPHGAISGCRRMPNSPPHRAPFTATRWNGRCCRGWCGGSKRNCAAI